MFVYSLLVNCSVVECFPSKEVETQFECRELPGSKVQIGLSSPDDLVLPFV